MKTLKYNLGLLALRIGFAGTMLGAHGWQKLLNFSHKSSEFADPLGIGPVFSLGLCVFAEFFCSAFVAMGFMTKYAIIPLIINMSVAVFMIHKNGPFEEKEKAVLYLVGFIAIYLLGPGKYSLGKKDRI